MAYSSVRVQFEIGHEASVRTKKTPEGFTHDWEVFVRGADNTDIQYFVDKVVFHLHETFPKPRRVIKEPPYVVKESGYAGFVLPIDVYLKNKEEPKKISFQYDLILQQSGPPVSKVSREPRLFQNPSEDFRRKLIRGGGVGVDTPSEPQQDDLRSSSSNILPQNKLKLSESPVKKHKPELTSNHSFTELFGTPIRRMIEPKKLPEVPKKISDADLSKEKKKINKHGAIRDEKDSLKEKEKYLEKDRGKEREKNKEKAVKRPSSPTSIPPPLVKSKEEHKKHEEKEKKKEEHEDKKKRKEEKEKEKKDKAKDVKDADRTSEKEHRKEKKELRDDYSKKVNSVKGHEEKVNSEKQSSLESLEKEKPDKEKHKHRHKKKEKEKNREKEKHRKEKDKGEKEMREREREREKTIKKKQEEGKEKEKIKKKSRTPSPLPIQERIKKGPLNALLDELGSSDSASPASEEEPIPSVKSFSKPPAKPVPELKPQPVNATPKPKSTNLNSSAEKEKEVETILKLDEITVLKSKKEKSSSKNRKKSEKETEKKKTKEDHRPRTPSSEREEEEVMMEKEKGIKEEREKERSEEEKSKGNKDKQNRKRKREKSEEKSQKTKKGMENNVTASQSVTDLPETVEEIRKPDKFTKEYVAQLKDLQHRIMTLEDNAELQKVVKVIAETGQYEITKKTFDFDLCALDFETVKRLQEFFAPT